MPSITGSFSGKITQQQGLQVNDQPNHQLGIAEVSGVQKSPDPLWQDSKISYWGITDLVNGKGTQTGYYDNVHPDKGRDWGTFEGKVVTDGTTMTVEGSFVMNGGDGKYRGISGRGKFKTVTKSDKVEATWNGAYELAQAKAG
jgi:hypothetical protein